MLWGQCKDCICTHSCVVEFWFLLCLDTPKTVAATLRTQGSAIQIMTSIPKAMASTPRAVASTLRTVASTPRTVASTPRTVASTPRTVASTPRTVASTPQAVASQAASTTNTIVRMDHLIKGAISLLSMHPSMDSMLGATQEAGLGQRGYNHHTGMGTVCTQAHHFGSPLWSTTQAHHPGSSYRLITQACHCCHRVLIKELCVGQLKKDIEALAGVGTLCVLGAGI